MPRMYYFWGLLILSLTLFSCGGGGGGSHGTDYSVSFEVTGDAGSDVGLGSSRTVMATVLKFDGNTPAPGIKVRFSIKQNQSGANLESVHDETQSNGTAAAVYRAGNTPGVDIIEVKAGGARGSISFNVAGGGLVVSTLILEAVPDEVDIGGYSTIRVGGRTFDDLPAVGAQVDYSFQVNNSNGAFIHENQRMQQISKYLDNEGWATLTYRAGNSSGIDIIQVNFPQAYGISDTISIEVGQGKALGQIDLEAFRMVEANNWIVRAVVRDRDGNLAPGVMANFNVDNGELSSSEEMTNVNGVAEVTLTTYGQATVYALVENIRQEVTVSVFDYFEAGSLTLDAPTSTNESPVTLRAVVRDNRNFPMIGMPVSFYADKGILTETTVSTDFNGTAVTQLDVEEPGNVRVWANVGNISISQNISFTIIPLPDTLQITTTSTPLGTVGQTYSFQFMATGGTPPYQWFVADQLPAGLSLGLNGVLSGTPTSAGSYSFNIFVIDSQGRSDEQDISMNID